MPKEKITLENVGPVSRLEIDLGDPGITILSGPNGSGKTTSLEGIQKTAVGKGRIPVKDGERSGSIEMPGAKVTICSNTRHVGGKCTIVNLEDQFNLGDLVDPGLKSADAADARRIKALVGLTGVKADLSMFGPDEFPDIDKVVIAEIDDLVEMAAIVKRGYESMARDAEKNAHAESTKAKTLESTLEEIDPNEKPLPIEAARGLHQHAVISLATIKERFESQERAETIKVAAKKQFDEAVHNYTKPSFESLEKESSDAAKAEGKARVKVDQLRAKLDDAVGLLEVCENRCNKATDAMVEAKQHEDMLESFRNVFDTPIENPVDKGQLDKEAADVFSREKQLDIAKTYARNVEVKLVVSDHKGLMFALEKNAAKYRIAASLTDDVISNAIDCKHLRVETKDGNTRLVVNHKRGDSTWFGDLSEGERWVIAIDIALEQPVFTDLGEQKAIVVIPQHAWESLDINARNSISEHAVERGIHILTAEASRDVSDSDDIIVKQFGKA